MTSTRTDAGLLVLDSNCYGMLQTAEARAKLESNLRVGHWEVWPSVVNLFEVLNTENAEVRNRLLQTMSNLAAGRPLLPWPYELLKRIGHAIATGEPGFTSRQTGYEWVLDSPQQITEKQLSAVRQTLADQERWFTKMHEEARPQIQELIKKHGVRHKWKTARDFLNEQWSTLSHLDTYIEKVWRKLKLPEPVPIEAVFANETWRLYFDGQGIGAYERAYSERPPQRVQQMDLLQLLYLGGTRRRMIASKDNGTIRAAEAVLHRRYPGTRVVHITNLVA